jgi:hypothetical protein
MSYITESQLAGYRSRTKLYSKNDVVSLNESSSNEIHRRKIRKSIYRVVGARRIFPPLGN